MTELFGSCARSPRTSRVLSRWCSTWPRGCSRSLCRPGAPPSTTVKAPAPGRHLSRSKTMNAVAKVESREMTRVETASTTPAQLLAMAVQQGADLDKLEKLMALQERWEANEARKAFMIAMNGFKSEPIEIRKSKHVEFTTRSGDTTAYDHAELSDITEAIGPKLAKYDLSYRWNIQQKEGAIAIECILTHASGHSERVLMHAPPDSSGGKNTIQQIA